MSPDTILVGTAFVGHVVVAADGFILRGACLTFRWRGRGRGGWICMGSALVGDACAGNAGVGR